MSGPSPIPRVDLAAVQAEVATQEQAQIEALANYLKALIDLYQLDGSLLERRGISAPRRKPVELSKR